MKTLVISDIHNKIEKADRIINSIDADKIVFLGDEFDDWNDTANDAEKVAHWLKKSLHIKNRIHLHSNHTMGYVYPNNQYIPCSGWTSEKSKRINEILTREDWNQLKWYFVDQNILFTHAGLHPKYVPPYVRDIKDVEKYLKAESKTAQICAESGQSHWFYRAGRARGGFEDIGGITWLDYSREFLPFPIEEINQIFGHTPDNLVREYNGNFCLDTYLNHYAIITNGKVEIFNYSDL